MELRHGNDVVEIWVADREPTDNPSGRGATRFGVRVDANGFSGNTFAWIDDEELTRFVVELARFDRERTDSVQLTSTSPGALQLQLVAVDGWGHLAVTGQVGRHVYSGNKGPYYHAVTFGFEFDPTLLASFINDFQRMLRANGS